MDSELDPRVRQSDEGEDTKLYDDVERGDRRRTTRNGRILSKSQFKFRSFFLSSQMLTLFLVCSTLNSYSHTLVTFD